MDTRATLTRLLQELRSLIVRYRPYHFKGSKLSCACGFASYVIEKALQERGYKTELVIGKWDFYDHAWVVCEGFILDVTLTQFDPAQPEIKVAKASRCRMYTGGLYGEAAHKDLQEGPWGEQSPYRYSTEVERILSEFRDFSL